MLQTNVIADPKAIAARKGLLVKTDPKMAAAKRKEQERINQWRKAHGLQAIK